MKKLRSVNQHTICQLTAKEQVDRNTTSPYVAVLKDEMEFSRELRDIDWEADSLEELVEWCKHY